MSAHTPGNWKAHKTRNFGWVVETDGVEGMGHVASFNTQAENEGNARLFASAKKTTRQRDALLEAANRASMLTGAMVASQFWDPPARELARPVDEALRAAIAACEDES